MSTGGIPDLIPEIAPEHRKVRYVPANAIPAPVQIVASILGVVAGTVLGVGFDDMLSSDSNLSTGQIKSLAAACVANSNDCVGLTLATPSSPVSAKISIIALGFLLLGAFFVLQLWPLFHEWYLQSRARNAASQGRGA